MKDQELRKLMQEQYRLIENNEDLPDPSDKAAVEKYWLKIGDDMAELQRKYNGTRLDGAAKRASLAALETLEQLFLVKEKEMGI